MIKEFLEREKEENEKNDVYDIMHLYIATCLKYEKNSDGMSEKASEFIIVNPATKSEIKKSLSENNKFLAKGDANKVLSFFKSPTRDDKVFAMTNDVNIITNNRNAESGVYEILNYSLLPLSIEMDDEDKEKCSGFVTKDYIASFEDKINSDKDYHFRCYDIYSDVLDNYMKENHPNEYGNFEIMHAKDYYKIKDDDDPVM